MRNRYQWDADAAWWKSTESKKWFHDHNMASPEEFWKEFAKAHKYLSWERIHDCPQVEASKPAKANEEEKQAQQEPKLDKNLITEEDKGTESQIKHDCRNATQKKRTNHLKMTPALEALVKRTSATYRQAASAVQNMPGLTVQTLSEK